MKIIAVDNFDRENMADVLIAENVPEFYGKYIADYLQLSFGGNYAPHFFKAVEDDYVLWRGMEEFI